MASMLSYMFRSKPNKSSCKSTTTTVTTTSGNNSNMKKNGPSKSRRSKKTRAFRDITNSTTITSTHINDMIQSPKSNQNRTKPKTSLKKPTTAILIQKNNKKYFPTTNNTTNIKNYHEENENENSSSRQPQFDLNINTFENKHNNNTTISSYNTKEEHHSSMNQSLLRIQSSNKNSDNPVIKKSFHNDATTTATTPQCTTPTKNITPNNSSESKSASIRTPDGLRPRRSSMDTSTHRIPQYKKEFVEEEDGMMMMPLFPTTPPSSKTKSNSDIRTISSPILTVNTALTEVGLLVAKHQSTSSWPSSSSSEQQFVSPNNLEMRGTTTTDSPSSCDSSCYMYNSDDDDDNDDDNDDDDDLTYGCTCHNNSLFQNNDTNNSFSSSNYQNHFFVQPQKQDEEDEDEERQGLLFHKEIHNKSNNPNTTSTITGGDSAAYDYTTIIDIDDTNNESHNVSGIKTTSHNTTTTAFVDPYYYYEYPIQKRVEEYYAYKKEQVPSPLSSSLDSTTTNHIQTIATSTTSNQVKVIYTILHPSKKDTSISTRKKHRSSLKKDKNNETQRILSKLNNSKDNTMLVSVPKENNYVSTNTLILGLGTFRTTLCLKEERKDRNKIINTNKNKDCYYRTAFNPKTNPQAFHQLRSFITEMKLFKITSPTIKVHLHNNIITLAPLPPRLCYYQQHEKSRNNNKQITTATIEINPQEQQQPHVLIETSQQAQVDRIEEQVEKEEKQNDNHSTTIALYQKQSISTLRRSPHFSPSRKIHRKKSNGRVLTSPRSSRRRFLQQKQSSFLRKEMSRLLSDNITNIVSNIVPGMHSPRVEAQILHKMRCIAITKCAQGHWIESHFILRKVLNCQLVSLGCDHPQVRKTSYYLGVVLRKLGRPEASLAEIGKGLDNEISSSSSSISSSSNITDDNSIITSASSTTNRSILLLEEDVMMIDNNDDDISFMNEMNNSSTIDGGSTTNGIISLLEEDEMMIDNNNDNIIFMNDINQSGGCIIF